MSESKQIFMDDPTVKSFKDETETIFVRGPWQVNNETYDFKLIEASGEEDYCTIGQMQEWKLVMKQKLS